MRKLFRNLYGLILVGLLFVAVFLYEIISFLLRPFYRLGCLAADWVAERFCRFSRRILDL